MIEHDHMAITEAKDYEDEITGIEEEIKKSKF